MPPTSNASASATCLLAITGAFAAEGGIAAVNRLVIHALSEAGYKLDVLALNEPPQAADKYASFANLRYRGFSGSKAKFSRAAWQSVISQRLALVLCDHVNLASILVPMRPLIGHRGVVFLHGLEVFAPLPSIEGKVGLLGLPRRVAVSEYTRDRVIEQFPRLQIEVCHLALDPLASRHSDPPRMTDEQAVILSAVDGTPRPLGQHIILHVGRMASGEQYKGQDVLIQAMPGILAGCTDAQLVLVGRGSDSARLLALAQSQPANTRSAIFMPGFVADDVLQRLYQSCYLFAMPSRGEGFGLVYIEAMRWGKPCLGSRVDAARCIIQDGITGVLVDDPQNPGEVADHISRLLDQHDLAQQMGMAGYQRVQDTYLFDHFKARFLQAMGL